MSILLDALRQAEKHKSKRSETSSHTVSDINTMDTSANIDEQPDLVELDILPDFEITANYSSTDFNTASSKQNDDETGFQTVEPLTKDNEQLSQGMSLDMKIEPEIIVDNSDNIAIKSEMERNEESLETEHIPLPQENVETSRIRSDSSTSAPTPETEIAKNILIASNKNSIKPVYWLLLLLLMAMLSAAYYLYSRTQPVPHYPHAEINAETGSGLMILNNEPASSYQNDSSQSLSTNSLQQIVTERTQVSTQEKRPLTIQQQKSQLDKVALSPSIVEFTVEPKDSSIEYPKAVKIKRKKQQDSEFRSLNVAYTAYQNQDFDLAERLYKQILQKNHYNIDALNALGIMAEKKGHKKQARVFFEHVMQLDSNQIFAKQALIRLQNNPIPSNQESYYKSLIDKFPDSAPSYAALANIYSTEKQWLKAQKVYFKAIDITPNNPDYHFNLAITLDHLSKPKIALRYYQKALQLSIKTKPLFSILVLQQRIQQLQGQ